MVEFPVVSRQSSGVGAERAALRTLKPWRTLWCQAFVRGSWRMNSNRSAPRPVFDSAGWA
jgi:hypothetical protein